MDTPLPDLMRSAVLVIVSCGAMIRSGMGGGRWSDAKEGVANERLRDACNMESYDPSKSECYCCCCCCYGKWQAKLPRGERASTRARATTKRVPAADSRQYAQRFSR